MVLQSSGSISILNLKTEFSGPTPSALTDYYRGGTYVPDTTANAGIPTSGKVSLTNFYGASVFTASLSGTFNFVTGAALVDLVTSTTSITVNISSGTLIATATGSGGSPGIQVNGAGAFVTTQIVSDGDTLKARHTTSGITNTQTTTVVTLDAYGSKTFTVETA